MKDDTGRSDELHISSGSIVRTILIVGIFALAWYLRDILLIVLTSIVLASVVEPPARYFMKKGLPRVLSLVLIYIFGTSVLVGLFYFFVPALLGDIARFSRTFPEVAQLSSLPAPLTGKDSPADYMAEAVSAGAKELAEGMRAGGNAIDLIKRGIEKEGAINSLSAVFGGLMSAIFIIVFSFYLAAQERGIENFLRLISPQASRSYIIDLWKRSQTKIGLWFQGQLLLGLVVGVLTFLILTILGFSSALLFAALIMVFELIPVFGPIMAAVPVVLVAFVDGIRPAADAFAVEPGIMAASVMIGVYFFIQQIESQVLQPQVVRKVTGIPPVMVILSLVIGGKLAGFLGIMLAVPLTAVLMEFLNDVAKERRIFEDA
jgi:predicted PurR-regulated permease PerM